MGASLLLLGGRRQHTVQAQIHCGFGVVVGLLPARIRLNQARVTCFPPNPSVVSASFESSIFASASEQKSKEALSATMSLSFESVSFASSTLGAGTAAALPHSRLFVSAMWTTRRAKVIWSALGL